MSDDLADDIEELLGPDAPLEMRLAGRTIIELRSSSKASAANTETVKALSAKLDKMDKTLQELVARPTVGSVLVRLSESGPGKTLATGLAQFAVWILLGIAAWATGMVEFPGVEPGKPPVVLPAAPEAPGAQP